MRRSTALCRSLFRLSGLSVSRGPPASSVALLAGRFKVQPSSLLSSPSSPTMTLLAPSRGFAGEAVDPDVFYPSQQAFVGLPAPRFTAPGTRRGRDE